MAANARNPSTDDLIPRPIVEAIVAVIDFPGVEINRFDGIHAVAFRARDVRGIAGAAGDTSVGAFRSDLIEFIPYGLFIEVLSDEDELNQLFFVLVIPVMGEGFVGFQEVLDLLFADAVG